MRVFVYEFVTGGGAGDASLLSPSLLAEGRAMAAAVTEDFASQIRCSVVTTRSASLSAFHDRRCDVRVVKSAADEREAIERLAAEANWTLLIAPETNGILLDRVRWAFDAGARLLSPSLETIRLTSDKQATCDHLQKAGIRAPGGCIVMPNDLQTSQPPPRTSVPAVLKPIDGCGSMNTYILRDWKDASSIAAVSAMRLETFIPGTPASVAVLCGREGRYPLPAAEQILSQDGRCSYLGGKTPIAGGLSRRAQTLALAAISTLPRPRGYLGVDLVLGEAENGSEDYVIEINPRLTTSYVGLRAICNTNLAAAMVDVAIGRAPALSWKRQSVQFSADGQTVGSKIKPPHSRLESERP
jgi:tyramine---L-glutamate ligase